MNIRILSTTTGSFYGKAFAFLLLSERCKRNSLERNEKSLQLFKLL